MSSYFKLLSRSSSFFIAQASAHQTDPRVHRYCVLSSLIHSWILLEAYINHVSDILSAGKQGRYEKAILMHKSLQISDDGEIIEINSHLPTLKRALFILNYFSKANTQKLRQTQLWNHIKSAEELRNEIIHPKQFRSERLTLQAAEITRESIIAFIKKIHRAVFHNTIVLN